MHIISAVIALCSLLFGLAVFPALARDETPIHCTLSPFELAPGVDSLKLRRQFTQVRNLQASLSMQVDCGPGGALNGVLVTAHHSLVRVDFQGGFKGQISGDFVLYTLGGEAIGQGELSAHVDGHMVVGDDHRPLLDDHGNVTTLMETIDGQWQVEMLGGGSGKGHFLLQLDFVNYHPFGGVMTGSTTGESDG